LILKKINPNVKEIIIDKYDAKFILKKVPFGCKIIYKQYY